MNIANDVNTAGLTDIERRLADSAAAFCSDRSIVRFMRALFGLT